MYLVISLLVLRAGYGIWLYQFLLIAYLFTLLMMWLIYNKLLLKTFISTAFPLFLSSNRSVKTLTSSLLSTFSDVVWKGLKWNHFLLWNPSLNPGEVNWAPSREFGTYPLCQQRRFRRACASAQSHQNLRCSLIQAVNQEEPSDRKPDPWPLWMAGHAQMKFVMTECLKTQIRLTGLI